MYHDFFNFHQVPFSIAPDPDFLYLGPRHTEGLAHLRNGLQGSGGFLLLTGEVGTGKTTLSRAILAELGNDLDIAFVVNPLLSERELLATICDQFKIPGRHEKASLKRLTDHLSQFLQKASEEGRQPVVLIDEAQHLLPSVLEQLRLLTNLETNSRKLLSVVLIGQPELQELLQRRELRQVAQRIVARYHLLPLTRPEMEAYICHRLERVGGSQEVFTPAALKAIWQFTQGTPRLINLLCDRSLQITAHEQQRTVSRKQVGEAIESLSFLPQHHGAKANQYPWFSWPRLGAVAVVAAALMWWWLPMGAFNGPQVAPQPTQATAQAPQPAPLGAGMAINDALQALAQIWDVGDYATSSEPCLLLQDVQLACLRGEFSLAELRQLDNPAIIATQAANQQYFLLLGVKGYEEHVTDPNFWWVWDGEAVRELSEAQLREVYSGSALWLWQIPDSRQLTAVVQEGLAKLVPFSLQQSSLARQLQWLRNSQQQRIQALAGPEPLHENDLSAVELAWLSAAYFTNRPRLTSQLQPLALGENAPRVRYSGAAATLNQVVLPLTSLTMPQALLRDLERTERSSTTSALPALASELPEPEGTRIRNPHQQVGATESDAVSPRLRALFDEAVADVGLSDVVTPPASSDVIAESRQALRHITELTANEQRRIPSFSYDSHMFSSRTQERWIRLNDRMLREGDWLDDLRVVKIDAAHTIFGYGDMLFRVDALEDFSR